MDGCPVKIQASSEGQISDIYDYHSVLVLGLVSLGPGPRARFFPRRSISSCVARGSNTWRTEKTPQNGSRVGRDGHIFGQRNPQITKISGISASSLVWRTVRWSDEEKTGGFIPTGSAKFQWSTSKIAGAFRQKNKSHFNQSCLLFSMVKYIHVSLSSSRYPDTVSRLGHDIFVMYSAGLRLSSRSEEESSWPRWCGENPEMMKSFQPIIWDSLENVGWKCMVQPHHFQGYHCWFSRHTV